MIDSRSILCSVGPLLECIYYVHIYASLSQILVPLHILFGVHNVLYLIFNKVLFSYKSKRKITRAWWSAFIILLILLIIFHVIMFGIQLCPHIDAS